MKLPVAITRFLHAGTEGSGDNQQQRINIINALSLMTSVLALATGISFYFLTHEPQVFIPVLLESTGFIVVIWLNKIRKYEAAGVVMGLYQVGWAAFFAILLGPLMEIVSALIFMISAVFIVYKKRSSIIILVSFAVGMLILTEVCFYTGFYKPLQLDFHTIALLRWFCIGLILFMNTLTMLLINNMHNNLLTDIEEKKNEIGQKKEELEKANTSRRRFLQETSHEIRNPLNAIFGIVQLMKMEEDDGEIPESLKPLIDNLYVASFNVKGIINNVLELSRIEAGQTNDLHRKEIEIRSSIRNFASIYEYVANAKSVHIDIFFEDKLPEVAYTDEIKLSQIINNLLTNAIHFTKPNSLVRVRCGVKENQWFISITDNGGGLAQEKLDEILQLFSTEKSAFKEGPGLGMYISKHFAELLNGTLLIDTKEGESTTFAVYFPLADTSGINTKTSNNVENTATFTDKNVLVIEDDRMNQAILKNFLNSHGISVQTANDGIDGLAAARRQPPDLIILDSHMPRMNGKETLLHIRRDPQLQHIPVIIASGDAFTESANGFLREGADEYVIKPIEFVSLQHVLVKYLGNGK